MPDGPNTNKIAEEFKTLVKNHKALSNEAKKSLTDTFPRTEELLKSKVSFIENNF